MAHEFSGKANIVKVDLGVSPDLFDEFTVGSMPTLVLLKDGAEVDRATTADVAKIKALLESAL